jgi:putative oxidoreductase
MIIRAARLRSLLVPLADLLHLAIRLHVANVFFKSGLTKIEDWDKTLFLFQEEYRVPLLTVEAAAFLGTFGELVFPVLLALGLAGRFSAASLWAVNLLAVVSYWHVLGTNEAALNTHFYWGALLFVLLIDGPGRLSLDHWIWRWAHSRNP